MSITITSLSARSAASVNATESPPTRSGSIAATRPLKTSSEISSRNGNANNSIRLRSSIVVSFSWTAATAGPPTSTWSSSVKASRTRSPTVEVSSTELSSLPATRAQPAVGGGQAVAAVGGLRACDSLDLAQAARDLLDLGAAARAGRPARRLDDEQYARDRLLSGRSSSRS